jgi:D-alanine-D-alanine ligase
MKITILYNDASQDAAIDERDVLVQRDAVCESLRRLGHDVALLPCDLNLDGVRSRLLAAAPDVAFNLVEALGGTDRLAPIATLLLESLGIPFTGSSTAALLATNNKIAAKRRLLDAGLPTPAWYVDRWSGGSPLASGCVIVKAVWEHASFEMDDEAVVSLTPSTNLGDLLHARQEATGRQHFAEQFIEGREFNLTVLGGADGPGVLPPAEIDFGAFPDGKPQIVGYRAKWDAGSFEFHHTPRRFDFPAEDHALLDHLAMLALRCWDEFGLRGYARVDFRVDRAGQPWILEVNTNPCLAPDAGLSAAVERSGIGYDRAIQCILEDAANQSLPVLT